jgi:hypothetical protein
VIAAMGGIGRVSAEAGLDFGVDEQVEAMMNIG